MTQLDLAQQLGITDKAVSKWERGLSCPDISSLPKQAEVLGVTVDELTQVKIKPKTEKKSWENIPDRILKAVPLAMGLALIVISILDKDLGIQDIAFRNQLISASQGQRINRAGLRHVYSPAFFCALPFQPDTGEFV